ncbi:M48 family metallopeptidase [Deinococcus hopiensis]|uniref:Zn-dependent protease with chaperone function n=1 Tax=Deinococcus hopiensis KR-140 TaxID=695939 RepID=A0A1W1VFJ0_9DEIO|nr:M48 family metallopeptidase [Deinococcus hopiensis]SMB92076.1 Zn-dependent protease with chaperone function [Deinococcus hopiensis KR-140]
MTSPSLPLLSLSGVAFDGRSSRHHQATLDVAGERATLHIEGGTETRWPLRQLRIDPPIPGVRRVLKFPDGARFETPDDAGVTALEARLGRNRALSGVRRLEARWWTALGALGLTLALSVAFVVFGIPMLARGAASATPRSVLVAFDRETVEFLDQGHYLGPSHLSGAKQAQLQAGFRQVTKWAGGSYPYRLLLRDGAPNGAPFEIGANAFALPNGTVVMTDQLVALSRSDRELLGVLAHESGHVTHRHALTGVYQGLGLTLLTVAVTGDLISAGTFAAAVPASLLQRGYSRDAETQADEVSGRFLMGAYGSTKPLRDILGRLETEDKNADENSVKAEHRVEDLLQTHPGTLDRIRHLREIENAQKPG